MNFRFALLALLLISLNTAAGQQKKSATNGPQAPDSANIYRNPTFGFNYRIPYGWVDRTKKMQEGNDAAKGEVLLAVFERPPDAAGDTINSAVVIGAEKAPSAMKKAEDYLSTLTETTITQGFKAEGEPSELEIDSQRVVRADFSKSVNDKLTWHQSTLVLLSKRRVVTFTFIAESDDALDNLIEGITFTAAGPKEK